MTLKQLRVAHRSYLREFDRAVVRRRADIKKVMAAQIKARKAMRNPNEPTTKAARALKSKLLNTIYRSVMNKASNAKCSRYHKDKEGLWVGPGPASKRKCRA
jgi:hypothetical protein